MATETRLGYAGVTPAQTHIHLRPLDAVIVACEALQESPCTWCQGLMTLLRRHLEAYIPIEPATFDEVR